MSPLFLQNILSTLPDELRDALVDALNNVRQDYVERRWEPAELNGGKISEVVFRILEWRTSSSGDYTSLTDLVKNFGISVRKFESDTAAPESVRFHIPNALSFLYSVRNKRGVGHVGGDVNPNHMDAEVVLNLSNWVVSELIRILHSVTVKQAQEAVEELVNKRNPLVWEVAGIRRILNLAMSYTDQVLVLLHRLHPHSVEDLNLFDWCGHSNKTSFRKQVLQNAHDETLIHYDKVKQLVHLSPKGVDHAERVLLDYTSSLG